MERFSINANEFVTEKAGQVSDHYEVKEILGEGSFGSVRRATHRSTHEDRAIKVLLKKKLNASCRMEGVLNEVSILRSLDHPNILKVHECYQDKFCYCIVTEMCTGGELFDKISKNHSLDESTSADYIRQILSCLVYIHEKNIVHRDLKPENFLLNSAKEPANLKLIDFGSAIHFAQGQVLSEKIGTVYYIAPEVISQSYTEKCDIWSTGVILFLMLSGFLPFPGKKDAEIMKNVLNSKIELRGGIWDRISAGAKDFLSKLLNKNPHQRLSAREALLHPWLHSALDHPVDRSQSLKILENLQSFHSEKKLQKITMSLIASQLTTHIEREEMLELFKKLDTDNNGTLSKEEIKNGISLFKRISDQEIDSIMGQVDINNSGEIDYSEFITACFDKNLLLSRERISLAFDEYDLEKKGKISREGLKNMLGKEHHYAEEVWDEIIQEVDKDGDGLIDKDDFTQMMMDITH